MKNKVFDFKTKDYDSLSISQLKRQADYWLRQFLLSSNVDCYYCPIKDKFLKGKNMEVAHFIDRATMNTRYDLSNCHLVSKVSNTWDAQVKEEGYKSLHHRDFEEYLGEQIVKDLRERAKIIKVFRREDYIETIEKFRVYE